MNNKSAITYVKTLGDFIKKTLDIACCYMDTAVPQLDWPPLTFSTASARLKTAEREIELSLHLLNSMIIEVEKLELEAKKEKGN